MLFAKWSKQELLVSALSLGRMSESFFYNTILIPRVLTVFDYCRDWTAH